LYENTLMKPVEIVLIRGGERWRRMMVEVNLTKVHCKQTWNCHNETPLNNLRMLIKMFLKRGNGNVNKDIKIDLSKIKVFILKFYSMKQIILYFQILSLISFSKLVQ
jgi:hypothetical protein